MSEIDHLRDMAVKYMDEINSLNGWHWNEKPISEWNREELYELQTAAHKLSNTVFELRRELGYIPKGSEELKGGKCAAASPDGSCTQGMKLPD
jgi:hypothetical protein